MLVSCLSISELPVVQTLKLRQKLLPAAIKHRYFVKLEAAELSGLHAYLLLLLQQLSASIAIELGSPNSAITSTPNLRAELGHSHLRHFAHIPD